MESGVWTRKNRACGQSCAQGRLLPCPYLPLPQSPTFSLRPIFPGLKWPYISAPDEWFAELLPQEYLVIEGKQESRQVGAMDLDL